MYVLAGRDNFSEETWAARADGPGGCAMPPRPPRRHHSRWTPSRPSRPRPSLPSSASSAWAPTCATSPVPPVPGRHQRCAVAIGGASDPRALGTANALRPDRRPGRSPMTTRRVRVEDLNLVLAVGHVAHPHRPPDLPGHPCALHGLTATEILRVSAAQHLDCPRADRWRTSSSRSTRHQWPGHWGIWAVVVVGAGVVVTGGGGTGAGASQRYCAAMVMNHTSLAALVWLIVAGSRV